MDRYLPDVISASDYYSGGMPMPGRTYNSASYRYGFNGKENDNEVKGTGTQAKTLFEEGSGLNAPTGVGFHLVRDLAKAIGRVRSIPSTSAAGTTILLSC